MTNQELEILKKVINNSIENKEENKFSRETLFKYYNLLKEAGHEIVLTSDVDRVIAEKAIEVFGKDIEAEVKEMTNLEKIYREWRELNEEVGANSDCGEKAVREDFTAYAELEEEITFEEMLELERDYEEE